MVLAYKNEDDVITEDRLLAMADEMASAAVSFNSHGYDQFIQAREDLKCAFRKLTVLLEIGQYNLMIQQKNFEDGFDGNRLNGRRSTDASLMID